MKIYISTITIAMLAFSCSEVREKTAEELLEKPKMEAEIYSAILKDSIHLSKFMDKMMADEKCKTMMTKNSGMMKMMCTSERMDSMMNADKEIMGNMITCMVERIEGDTSACNMMFGKMMGRNATKEKIMSCCEMDKEKKEKKTGQPKK